MYFVYRVLTAIGAKTLEQKYLSSLQDFENGFVDVRIDHIIVVDDLSIILILSILLRFKFQQSSRGQLMTFLKRPKDRLALC